MSSLNRRCRCNRHYGLAASSLALSTLEMYSDFEFFEILVRPNSGAKSNIIKPKDSKKQRSVMFKVYPNPTSRIVLIAIPVNFENIRVELVNNAGKEVFSKSALNNLANLNLRSFPNGSYNLMIRSADGEMLESQHLQIAK